MGIVMKRSIMSVAAMLAIGVGSASAADLPAKVYKKAPPIVAFDPWDIAFGSAIMNDYVFRGVTQSNHKPSVAAYFEPRYNVTKDVQLYIGTSFESISFANRAAAEVDIYGGIRPTFGAFAFDFGVWGYLYPGGTCFNGGNGGLPVDAGGRPISAECFNNFLLNANVIKKDLSFFEGYAKVNYTINDNWQFGLNEFYSPNFLNSGAWGNYASITGKYTAPSTVFGTSGVGMYVSGDFGRLWLGPAAWFYGTGFTYKVFTLDFRYSDTDLSKANCNAFTSDNTATFSNSFSAINPTGVGSNWCGATGIVKLSADLTAMTNLK
jgi:hypothetical protein